MTGNNRVRSVCIATREYAGIAGAGGLKDVVRAQARGLFDLGIEVTVILPGYGFMAPRPPGNVSIPIMYRDLADTASISELSRDGIHILTVEHPIFAEKFGVYTYTGKDAPSGELVGDGHKDADAMNCVFQEAVAKYLGTLENPPDIIHCHDGHTGLLGVYLCFLNPGIYSSIGLVTTIHNAGSAYQQAYRKPEEAASLTGLPEELLAECIVNGLVNPLLAAGMYGVINTVSPGYAKELSANRDSYSGGFAETTRKNGIRISGIYNGLDADYWARESGYSGIPGSVDKYREGISDRRRRIAGDLAEGSFPGIEIFGDLPRMEEKWILFHGRLTEQKGLDEICGLVSTSLAARSDIRIIIYGQGDPRLEARCRENAVPGSNWTFLCGYDDQLTPLIISAASWMMVPSLWEPCGQIDMIGQLLGALPIVRSAGGLKKVRNRRDGFSYSPRLRDGLHRKLEKALSLEDKHPGRVLRMRKRAENTVYGRWNWRKILIRGYLPLYRKSRHSRAKHRTAGS